MSEPIRTFWCALEPCDSLRHKPVWAGKPAKAKGMFDYPEAFCAHLANEHDLDADALKNLERKHVLHIDGSLHYWDTYVITSGDQVVGDMEEWCARTGEDAEIWNSPED